MEGKHFTACASALLGNMAECRKLRIARSRAAIREIEPYFAHEVGFRKGGIERGEHGAQFSLVGGHPPRVQPHSQAHYPSHSAQRRFGLSVFARRHRHRKKRHLRFEHLSGKGRRVSHKPHMKVSIRQKAKRDCPFWIPLPFHSPHLLARWAGAQHVRPQFVNATHRIAAGRRICVTLSK